jgi:DNA-binding Lrp family transcriptional regulator
MTPYQDKIRQEQEAIRLALQAFPEGAGIEEIRSSLLEAPALRTLQRRLEKLVDAGAIKISGAKRTAKYHLAGAKMIEQVQILRESENVYVNIPLSQGSLEILEALSKPYSQRKKVGYNRQFADAYRPNVDYFLSVNERKELAKANDTHEENILPAGTYAKQILQRFLLDLSWNSSRLEGNTYSLLDTERLLSRGEQAAEKSTAEAQMILNHKDAIEFMVAGAAEISYNHYTVQNLHALLSNNLLPDPAAPGRLRTHPVGIKKSAYTPTAIPQLIAEMFDLILAKANAITNPHEQAFFMMVQLPYLQPFEDVNKRLSRIAANISLIQHNLIPISFIGVPDNMYIQGLLGVYELNRIDLLKDVFLWACARSADRYARVRQTLGAPDPLRIRYREALQLLITEIVTGNRSAAEATGIIKNYALQLPPVDQARFIEMIETELLSLHEGNFARYRVRPSEFKRWKELWLKR